MFCQLEEQPCFEWSELHQPYLTFQYALNDINVKEIRWPCSSKTILSAFIIFDQLVLFIYI